MSGFVHGPIFGFAVEPPLARAEASNSLISGQSMAAAWARLSMRSDMPWGCATNTSGRTETGSSRFPTHPVMGNWGISISLMPQ